MFADIQKQKEFIRPTLQEMLEEVLQAEGKWYQMEVRSTQRSKTSSEMIMT